jgi:hypothetical protein
MRLKIHSVTANEELIILINEGYEAIVFAEEEYKRLKEAEIYDDNQISNSLFDNLQIWADKAESSLLDIFPTRLEANLFANPEIPFGSVSGDSNYQTTLRRAHYFVRNLNQIRLKSLPEYTDLPLDVRLYVEDIDSFRKVRDVNPSMVLHLLDNGYLNISEDKVQTALERILSVSFHKKDWGGEQNDLYTANLLLNGCRCETAFLLKGNGLKSKVMEIKNCGKNGDQLVRLCDSPAKLFIVQFVGVVSEAIVKDIDGKIRNARTEGRDARYCIIDGQDTARLLTGYGEI